MPFRDQDQLRLHKEDVRARQDNADDVEFHKTAWWAFRWFLLGIFTSTAIITLLQLLTHWRK